jgi:cysteine synthase A
LELIGRTPLMAAENLKKELKLEARLLVKLEYLKPDRERERPGGKGND